MNIRTWLFVCMVLMIIEMTMSADDLRAKYVGKTDCTQDLKSAAGRYGIRLDSTQKAYLSAYELRQAHILTIVQYEHDHDSCGVIRDVVQSHGDDSSFVWECVDPKNPSEIVVGTWPAKHPGVTGPAVEAWNIDVTHLHFEPIRNGVNCEAGNYAGSDEGDSLADWARKRAPECAEQDARQAEENTDHLSNWNDVYQSLKRFSRCDDGAIAEGYSDAIGKLLANDWNQFSNLVRLAGRDKTFQNFVLRHVDGTIPADRLKKVEQNAKAHCPNDASGLCNLIIRAASQ